MSKYTTSAEAMQRMVAVIKEHAPLIPGLSSSGAYVLTKSLSEFPSGILTIHWNRGFGVSCSLVAFVEDATVHAEIHWSDTTRNGTTAKDAIALYSQVAQLACLLESIAGSMEIADVTP